MKCPSCNQEAGVGRFCQHCGAPLDAEATATDVDRAARTPIPTPTPSSLGEMGFAPGQMFAARYRIVGLLGRGGMGEVYRADDLKLGHPVALKFLSPKHAQDAAFLQRFIGEVRLARQVSHPHVCRVHDIGESDGHHYLSMEYVDGEDLASLLKRIGRLPADKGLEVARQLCAGLAAAHDRGVLHRDLKPANIMLDGRGHVRITDFGLAVAAGQETSERSLAGTPAYMAPEQLTGAEITARTDLYALGLVLYEVFTGKRALEGRTVAERLTKTDSVVAVAGADPAVERAILRCLERDPQKRPVSPQAVAATLPGGDALAAAVAAGETPSPEMVAAAGEAGVMNPALAAACLAGVALGLIGAAWLVQWSSLHRFVPVDKPPEFLAVRAREILTGLGYTEPPVDSAHFFSWNEVAAWGSPLAASFVGHLAKNNQAPERWHALRAGQPAALFFVYRQSPRPLIAFSDFPAVTAEDPPLNTPGMVNLHLDTQGRLLALHAVAPQFDASTPTAFEPEWSKLFAAAGLNPARFQPATPQWTAALHSDTRAAWEGVYPDAPGIALRVEAAASRGRPVYFALIAPWTSPREGWSTIRPSKAAELGAVVLFAVLLLGGAFLCRRNLRLGRGDRSGAVNVALFMAGSALLDWELICHHAPTLIEEAVLFLKIAASGLLIGAVGWLAYLAVEPYARRRWPQMLISWSRLLAGKFRDPLVGRDLLLGTLAGVALFLVFQIARGTPAWWGFSPLTPEPIRAGFGEPRWQAALFIRSFAQGPFLGVMLLFFLLFLRVALRKQWLATLTWIVLLALCAALPRDARSAWDLIPAAVQAGVCAFILLRLGLLNLMAALFVWIFLLRSPLTLDTGAWYAAQSFVSLGVVAAIAAFGFFTATAGRRRFSAALLEEE